LQDFFFFFWGVGNGYSLDCDNNVIYIYILLGA
jgi:hypothetical protein